MQNIQKSNSIASGTLPSTYQYEGLFRTTRIPSCVLSMSDLRRLNELLQSKTAEALERHLKTLIMPPDSTPERFEDLKVEARRLCLLTVTVLGMDGEQLVVTSTEGLDGLNLPERIASITFDSAASLRRFNATPLNRFTVQLDFREPPGFDTYNPWDQPTPNNSQIETIGNDHTWVTAVDASTRTFFDQRKCQRSWLHSQIAFNAANWIVGIPAALWIVFRLDSHAVALQNLHTALRGAIYIYLFLISLLGFRLGIFALRWVFPIVEFEGARTKKARGLVGLVVSSILLAFVYDILRTLVW